MTNQTVKTNSTLKKSIRLMIVLVAVFALLIVGYFAVLRPLLQEEDTDTAVVYDPIWASEVASVGGRLLMYPHYEREQISKITVHNPDNAKYGEQYVDWGFYKYSGPEENDDGLVPGDFYLQKYEYAPFDATALSNMVVAAGYTLSTARVEDHCSDYSRYGLEFASPEEALSVTMETSDGKTYVYYVGDQTPSGGGYYVRVLGEDTLLATGEVMERDSVYILVPTNLEASVLINPLKMITPTLTLPVSTQSAEPFDSFRIWKNEPQYLTESVDANGNVTQKLRPAIYLKPIDEESDPFSLFAGLGVYYSLSHPGYFGSTRFENLVSLFADFSGTEVVELGTVQYDDEGEEYIGFTGEIQKKYGLDNPQYTLCYRYQGIDNYVYFSALQEDSYYYAYSLVFNTINKVSVEDAYFLSWEDYTYLQNQLFYMMIGDCDSISVSGKYYDMGLIHPEREGWQTVTETYQLTGADKNLVVNSADGTTLDTENFRDLYQIMISILNRGTVSAEDAEAAMKNDSVSEISVTTRKKVVYKTDENGATTSEVDYILESVTKIFRFYELSDGRLLCTIEQIDPQGQSSGETGSFYVLSSRLDQMFAAVLDLREGLPVDVYQRY